MDFDSNHHNNGPREENSRSSRKRRLDRCVGLGVCCFIFFLMLTVGLTKDETDFWLFLSPSDNDVSTRQSRTGNMIVLEELGNPHKYAMSYTDRIPVSSIDQATSLEAAQEYYRHKLREVAHVMYAELHTNSSDTRRAIPSESQTEVLNQTNTTTTTNSTVPIATTENALLPDFKLMTLDMSPLYDVVSEAIDRIGVDNLFFGIFSTEGHKQEAVWKWYQKGRLDEIRACNDHHGRYQCDASQLWWFYHFVGAITSDKLLHDGEILWGWNEDGVPTIIPSNRPGLLTRFLHQHQAKDDVPFTDHMAFHSIHSILWQYISARNPNLAHKYPKAVANNMCGDQFARHDVKLHNKWIGRECFHGIGHAVYYLVMHRQLQRQYNISQDDEILQSARIQLRPSAGIELDETSWCEVYDMCNDGYQWAVSMGFKHDARSLCFGGFKHSHRIYSGEEDMRWHDDTPAEVIESNYDEKFAPCVAKCTEGDCLAFHEMYGKHL